MKKQVLARMIFILAGVLGPRVVLAQGAITYISNLSDASNGSLPVGSDAWFAAQFISGENPEGYALNSVELAMTDASGSPADFSVMLYSSVNGAGTTVGNNLGVLSGSLNPTTAGTYTYTAPPDLTLSPLTIYFIVVTSGTAVTDGAYNWSATSVANSGYNSYLWGGEATIMDSSDGFNWNYAPDDYGQFSLNATPTPEPNILSMFATGGLIIAMYHRKRFNAAYPARE